MAKFITVTTEDKIKHYINIDAIIQVKRFPGEKYTFIYTTECLSNGGTSWVPTPESFDEVIEKIKSA